MRLSVDQDDPGYAAWVAHPKRNALRVYIDGVEQKWCFTADTEQGFVVIGDRDSDGRLLIDEARDQVVTKVLRGNVQITVD